MARILILANNDVGLYKFRKELIETLIKKGDQVYISSPFGSYINDLCSMGCVFFETKIDRRGTNPIKDTKLLIHYFRLIKKIKPDAVMTYTIKPNVYGGLACQLTDTTYLTNVTGLGTSIENGGLLQKITLMLYSISLHKAACVFFQNEPNQQFFVNKNIVEGKTKLIPGSGVNLNEHCFEGYPNDEKNLKFLFLGRIMKNKGIDELLEAAKTIKEMYPDTQFDLVGDCEENYIDILSEYERQGIIKYYGHQDDVHTFIKNSHATILPSYHEGTANVLLESAATGRPVLASNVTGCRETFDESVTGFGFNVKDASSLIEAVIKFINLPHEQKKSMGVAGRTKMEREYDRTIVIDAYLCELEETVIG